MRSVHHRSHWLPHSALRAGSRIQSGRLTTDTDPVSGCHNHSSHHNPITHTHSFREALKKSGMGRKSWGRIKYQGNKSSFENHDMWLKSWFLISFVFSAYLAHGKVPKIGCFKMRVLSLAIWTQYTFVIGWQNLSKFMSFPVCSSMIVRAFWNKNVKKCSK